MIDTIILTIPRENFTTLQKDDAAVWELHSRSGFYEKHIKTQTPKQKHDGIYRPRISMIRRGRLELLRIEFSIPKLIFGNNVDEVCEKDFENVLETLKLRLQDFGVYVFIPHLRKAIVSTFHPSKNILLSGGYTASGIIKELRKINLTKKMDLNRDSFRNDGESIQLYTNSHSLVIYDKVKDLNKPKGRALDKDSTPTQQSLFQELENLRKPEILRIEARLSKKVKMDAMLVKCGFDKNPTFEDIFKEKLCLKIVAAYWNELVIKDNLFLFSLSNNPKQILKDLIKKDPSIKPKEAVYLVGLSQLCKDEDGIRELRSELEKQAKTRTWYRTATDIKKLSAAQSPNNCHSWINQIEAQIKDYSPLKYSLLICKEK